MKHEQPFGLRPLALPFPLEEGSESEDNEMIVTDNDSDRRDDDSD